MICCKRVYEPVEEADGYRVRVDRLWPRGMPKEQLQHDQWLREVAPSAEVRRQFAHHAEAFDAFREGYRREHDNARVLQDFLEDGLERREQLSVLLCRRAVGFRSCLRSFAVHVQ
nr:DUF488 family protein [uncultured Pseudomonas sp.]